MICNKCGKENEEGAAFCAGCGSNLTENANSSYQQDSSQHQTQGDYTQPQYQQPQYNQQQYEQPQQMQDDGMDYTPISMWGYFGYQLLFSIPCVGLILLLIFSFGGTKNINLRNFSRSYFCYIILITIIFAIITIIVTGLVIGGLADFSYYNYY